MSEKRLRELFSLSPVAQVRHWAGSTPWGDDKFDNKSEILMNQVVWDANFHTIRMPLFMKPCFGQPTAYARHGGNQPITHPRFGTVKSRCMRCLAKDACERLAKARLCATTDTKKAWIRYGQAGGGFGLKNPSLCPTAQREFDGLVAALSSHGGFNSTNDVAAIAELDRRDRDRKLRDAEAKRLARRKAIKAGHFNGDFLALMTCEAQHREALLVEATAFDGLPPNLSRLPISSAQITADVWFVRECKRIRGERINPSSVAAGLIALSPDSYPSEKFNSLRQRTKNDLARVATLEKFIVRGFATPIWPKFDLAAALDELDLTTPYTPQD